MTISYVTAKHVQESFKVSANTLRSWADQEKIATVRTPGGKRLYSQSDIRSLFAQKQETKPPRDSVCYARVSSAKQESDLQRQIATLQSERPEDKIYSDIGSGLNFKRKDFIALLDRVDKGDIERITVVHKDRLCRYAFDLLAWWFERKCCQVVVLSTGTEFQTESEASTNELAQDVLSVINFFVARNNGFRSGKNKRKRAAGLQKNKDISQKKTETNSEPMDGNS